MKNIILFDDDFRNNLLPLVFHRPIGELRLGIQTITEKWQPFSVMPITHITQDYLSSKYPVHITGDNTLINGRLLPSEHITPMIEKLDFNESLMYGDQLLAVRLSEENFKNIRSENEDITSIKGIEIGTTPIHLLESLSDIFMKATYAISYDFQHMTRNRTSLSLDRTNVLIGSKENLFIEDNAVIRAATINVEHGPVYIGKNAEIMEGSLIRGPFVLGKSSTVKMGAKIYGATGIGVHCKVGGEINNVIMQDYSNKGHDGFIGNAVIGSWCNLGADTNCSNLKNNYGTVKQWHYPSQKFINTGRQFVGLVMGDYSKCGINTMFNTGTIVGIACNIFGSGFPEKYIPSFSFGGPQHTWETNKFESAIYAINSMMRRRKKQLTKIDINILKYIFKETNKYRVKHH